MIKIRSIKDLNPKAIKAAQSVLNDFDFGAELMRWSVHASHIPWETKYQWNSHRQIKVFHPSSLGRDCDYQLYLDLIGAKAVPKIHYSLQCVFDTGTAVEAQLQYYLHTYAMKQGWVYNSHPKIKSNSSPVAREYVIGGEGDGEGTIALSGELVMDCLFEIKTARESAYQRLVDPRKSHKGYIKQMHAYMACLDLPFGWLIFINKNVSHIKAFPIFFDHVIWKDITDRLDMIKDAVKRGKQPAKTVSNYSCLECKYLEVCGPPIKKRSTPLSGIMRDR